MEQILQFIQNYGLPVFVIATSIIVLLGILKLCKVFNKIQNANVKKFLYYVIDIALAFGGVAIYFAIFKESFADYVTVSLTQITATTTLYAIYENLGVRKLVQLFWAWFGGLVQKDKHKQLVKFAKAVGLDNAIEELKDVSLKEAEKLEQKIAEEKKENANISVAKEV